MCNVHTVHRYIPTELPFCIPPFQPLVVGQVGNLCVFFSSPWLVAEDDGVHAVPERVEGPDDFQSGPPQRGDQPEVVGGSQVPRLPVAVAQASQGVEVAPLGVLQVRHAPGAQEAPAGQLSGSGSGSVRTRRQQGTSTWACLSLSLSHFDLLSIPA